MSRKPMPSDVVRAYAEANPEGSLPGLVAHLQGEFLEYSRNQLETIARSGLRAMRDEGKVRTGFDDQYGGQPLYDTTS